MVFSRGLLRFWGVCGSSFLYKCTQAVLKDCCFSLQLFGNVLLEVTYLESDSVWVANSARLPTAI